MRLQSLLLACVLASGLCSTPAGAFQTPPDQGVPIVNPTIDGNGVNLPTGGAVRSSPSISIGEPGAGGLSYSQVIVNNQWRHNLMGGVAYNASTQLTTVFVGDAVEVFETSGGSYTPKYASASTLVYNSSTGIYTYTLADGTVALFDEDLVPIASTYGGSHALITQLTEPNGFRLTYHYMAGSYYVDVGGNPYEPMEEEVGPYYRLQSVTTNTGYQMHLDYQSNWMSTVSDFQSWYRVTRARLINNAVDYCNPTAHTCPSFTQTWPTLTISDITVPGSYTERRFTDSLSRLYRYRTDSSWRLSQIYLPGDSSPSVTMSYGASGVSTVSVNGLVTTYTYSTASGVRTTTINAPGDAGNTIVKSDVDTGLVQSVQTPSGDLTEYEYDSSDRLEAITFPEGNSTSYTYDSRHNVTSVTQTDKDGTSSIVRMTASYPSTCSNPVTCNQPNWVEDAAGNRTDFTYNSTHGGVLTVTQPAVGGVRPQTRIDYAAFYAHYKNHTGSIVAASSAITLPQYVTSCRQGSGPNCTSAANEIEQRFTYGSTTSSVANNLQLTELRERGVDGSLVATTTYAYDAVGNLTQLDPPLEGTNNRSVFIYDSARQQLGVIGPDPDAGGPLTHAAQRTTYNDLGQVTQVEFGTVPGYGSWGSFSQIDRQTVTYDSAHRMTHSRLITGSTTHALIQYSYDNAGRVECVAQRMNTAIFASPPSSACSLGTQGSVGPDRIARTYYDTSSRRTSVITAYGTTDASTEAAWTYTANGRVATLTDGMGNLTTYEYDGFDRLRDTHYPNTTQGSGTSNSIDYTRLSYDAYGRVNSRRTRSGQTFSYTYDALNRVATVTAPSGAAGSTFTYDNHGRILTVYDGSQTLTNTYNARGWLASQTFDGRTVSYLYNEAGQRTRMTWPDSFYVTYAYTRGGQLASIFENGDTTGLERLADFTYDQHGRRTLLERGNAVDTDYNYDAASRLEELVQDLTGTASDRTLDFTYNPAGQILTRTDSNPSTYAWTDFVNFTETATHNGLNQILSVTSEVTAPDYDDNGNMIRDHLGQTYGYDQYNRLTDVGSIFDMEYDPVGRLHRTWGTGVALREFLYDGLDLIAQYNSSGVIQGRYVHGPGMDEPLVLYYASGARRWLLADERGSIIAETDNSGNRTRTYSYDEYGVPSSTDSGRFGYTGQVWLEETGLYHYKNRAYNPLLGRFMQADPIGVNGGMNLYAYVGGDPINFVDPLGLESEKPDVIEVTCRRTSADSCGGTPRVSRPSLGGGIPRWSGEPSMTPGWWRQYYEGAEDEDVIVITYTRVRFGDETLILPSFIPRGEAVGSVCGHGYLVCAGVVLEEQGIDPMTTWGLHACRAAASLCVARANQVYSSQLDFDSGVQNFPYGSGRVEFRNSPGRFDQRFVPGWRVPANDY